MIEITLFILLSYHLHRMARQKGLSPWPFVLNFLAAFLLMAFLVSYTFISIFGQDALKTQEGMRNAMYMVPFVVLFQIMLYIYFRKKIGRSNPPENDWDDQQDDTPPTPKKDLSYFR